MLVVKQLIVQDSQTSIFGPGTDPKVLRKVLVLVFRRPRSQFDVNQLKVRAADVSPDGSEQTMNQSLCLFRHVCFGAFIHSEACFVKGWLL